MRAALVVVVLLGACSKDKPKPTSEPPAPKTTEVKPTEAKTDPCAKAVKEGAMAWIADDYSSAVACAKAKKVPVVLDEWAPWCHTCLSMQSTVFTDASFGKDADKFVFASIDTEREGNATIVAKFPLSAWPTFYVINAADDAVLARFVGSASVDQFHAFLDAGAKAQAGGAAGADARLLGAERATATKDLKAAEEELVAALAAAPPDWVRKPDTLVSLIRTREKRGDFTGCLATADKYMDDTGNTASASDFLVYAMACADKRDKDEAPRVKALRERAVARWQKLLADDKAPLSVDDRSDAMASTRETLEALGKKDEAKAMAEKQLKLLDDAAAKAPDAKAAATYNPHRAEVYAYLGRPLDLVPALEKSAKDLPGYYEPRIRLAWVLMKGGKLADAAKWADEALSLVYGPRKARVLSIRAEIANKAKDPNEAKYRAELVKVLEALPADQAQPEALEAAKKQLAAVEHK
jgi:thiol-disulfide isomerase/thioredoxin